MADILNFENFLDDLYKVKVPTRYLYFFMDLKSKNIPSFVLHTFHLIHLAQDIRYVSMFCPPRYLNFFQGFEIWKHNKFGSPHYSFDTPSSGEKKIFYVLSSTILILFHGFEK